MKENERPNRLLPILNEREDTLSVSFDPKKFTHGALREILRYQVYSSGKRSIILSREDKDIVLSHNHLREARNKFGAERREYLSIFADAALCFDAITISQAI